MRYTDGDERIKNRKKYRKRRTSAGRGILIVLVLAAMAAAAYFMPRFLQPWINTGEQLSGMFSREEASRSTCLADPGSIPDFCGEDYVVLNGNRPNFTEFDLTHIQGENYAPLDSLGRCGPAVAMLEQSMMPLEERGDIGSVKPSGWQVAKYPDRIEDTFLYNRCHLIAYAMTGQNDNERNLITGTDYMNKNSMLVFEKQVLWFLNRSADRVLYRVTPFFKGREMVARGVEMEAWSVDDGGESVCFHVFVYNYQPGIDIDYATGRSREAAPLGKEEKL